MRLHNYYIVRIHIDHPFEIIEECGPNYAEALARLKVWQERFPALEFQVQHGIKLADGRIVFPGSEDRHKARPTDPQTSTKQDFYEENEKKGDLHMSDRITLNELRLVQQGLILVDAAFVQPPKLNDDGSLTSSQSSQNYSFIAAESDGIAVDDHHIVIRARDGELCFVKVTAIRPIEEIDLEVSFSYQWLGPKIDLSTYRMRVAGDKKALKVVSQNRLKNFAAELREQLGQGAADVIQALDYTATEADPQTPPSSQE